MASVARLDGVVEYRSDRHAQWAPLPADVQLHAVRDYEQVDREISATLHPTVAWFIALGTAIFFLLLGISAWMYQIYSGLGVAGYNPPVMWGVYIVLLYTRWNSGWRGRKAAYLATFAFVAALVAWAANYFSGVHRFVMQ